MAILRYQQVERWIRQRIQDRRWLPGERLPSIRVLCQQLDVSKITVQHALQRLEAQRLVIARPRSGYFVSDEISEQSVEPGTSQVFPLSEPAPVSVHSLLLDVMARGAAFDLCPPSISLEQRMMASADGRERDTGVTQLNRNLGRALRRQQNQHHHYYDQPAGEQSLRFQICERYRRRSTVLGVDEICISNGCQHSLFLALMAVCQSGDVVAVESPGFYGVLQLLEQLRIKVVEIPVKPSQGLDMQVLEQTVTRWPVKAVMVTPAYATPIGALLTSDARQRLISLANQHDLAIIEDDIYAETAFGALDSALGEEQPAPVKSLDTQNRVILCGSYSKCLSKDLRLGWVAGGRWHQQIQRLKLVSQLASSRSHQIGLADFIEDGGLVRHLKRYRQKLRSQRDQLIRLLKPWPLEPLYLPDGGLTLWLSLPESIDALRLYRLALASGVVIVPGPLFSASGQYRNCVRLSYAHPWTPERQGGLKVLLQIVERELERF